MAASIKATIDDLNQYLQGNVTEEGLIDTLEELLNFLKDVTFQDELDSASEMGDTRFMENLNEGKKKKASYMAELAEIDKQSSIVAMEAKINKLAEMVETKNARLSMVSEDENLSELIDKKQVKMMEREIKEIERAKMKLEKLYEKMSGSKKKKVVDEEEKMDEGNNPGEDTGIADLDGVLGNYMNEEDGVEEGIEDELKKNKGKTWDEAEPAQVTKEKGLAEEEMNRWQKLAGL